VVPWKVLLLALSLPACLLLSPLPCLAENETFAIVSDSHVGASNSAYPAFIKVMDQEKIDMLIHTGDAIDHPGSEREWRAFLEMTGPARKLYLAPGNHDIRGAKSVSVYLKHFPKLYYSFSDGDTLFVLLNTELPGEESMIGEEQFGWLKGELERPFQSKFVFLHEPLFPVVQNHGLDRHKEERDRLHGLFTDMGVRLVVAGHDHIYNRSNRSGITYVIAGAMGGVLPPILLDGNPFRYMVVTRKNGAYSFVVRDMAGVVRDEFAVGGAASDRPLADPAPRGEVRDRMK
jgi:predicted phosphodiesterase